VAVLKIQFSKYGEKWNVTYYQDSGIEHPGEETRDGTPFDLDEMRVSSKGSNPPTTTQVSVHSTRICPHGGPVCSQ